MASASKSVLTFAPRSGNPDHMERRVPSAGGVLPPVAERAGVFAPMIPLIRSTDQLFISQLDQQRIVVYGNIKKYEEPLKKLKGTFRHVTVTFSVRFI